MKYKVLHSHIAAPNLPKSFERDQIVTKADLNAAGHEIDFLIRNDAVEALPGTEDVEDVDPKSAETVKVSKVGAGGKSPNAGASPAGKS